MSVDGQTRAAAVPRMLLTRNVAAAALGVSLRHFQRHVQPFVTCVYLSLGARPGSCGSTGRLR
jgi:hypothetical protein